MKLVIYPPVASDRLRPIVEAAGSMQVVNAATEPEAVAAIADADAYLGKLSPPLLAAAKRLRWVQTPTVSLEHYMFPELESHPCLLTNMRGLFSDVIADQVLGYVICFARQLHTYIRNQLDRRWDPVGGEEHRVDNRYGPGITSPMDLSHLHLSDCSMGIIGMGAIGTEVAKRARAFSMRVTGFDPHSASFPPEIARAGSLEDLLSRSDFVVVTAPHTPATVKLFRDEQFAAMKPSAYFINIGRGAVVDLDSLVAALRAGRIAGAALDVFEKEPLPADHPLWDFPNVILTPHIAGYSPRIAQRHLGVLLENIRRFTSGEGLINVVDKRRWF
jgi:phosphoglycerate dehydrogenase-like enzyme